MTADGAAERLSRIAPNSLTEQRKPARYRDIAGRKLRDSASKIASIVFCAAHGRKYICLLGTPQAPKKDRTEVIENRLTPK